MGSKPFHFNHQPLRNVLLLVLLVSLTINATTLVLSQTVFGQWQHLPLHTVVESTGALVAFFVVYLLLVAERHDGRYSALPNWWVL
ncbi:hypothetical protein QWI17_20590 [Gilvimarinus sp. SDUM040013]|uniref:Uncharacterized protein n=1 Tax=Gilvimarinus gilvus TaxID=3058038 RepID=A0ABU4RSF6_9GAMM|nr:hypothetical protein [Gilvimarinus sp. SDUM040013]MDO3388257.1 hypothetical protein [Gilvimarinus sp. SDUM040013]MDX6847807.1 hypothetical protein [Gilvimarinus sp. SDUM040013]